jgi:hypothetical protein
MAHIENLPVFENQSDWTEQNIERIKVAIENGIIKTDKKLRNHIGNQSKKKGLDNKMTIGSLITGYKLDDGRRTANDKEHNFYREYTNILKSITKQRRRNGLLYFDDHNLSPEQDRAKNSNFTNKIYDYMMGETLYNEVINNNHDILNLTNYELVEQVEKIMNLRYRENQLFNLLREKQDLPGDNGAHERAIKREQNNLKQLITYLEWKDKFNELITEARNYKKYLKYKQKYITLKNRSKK